jgi:ABC-type transport system substrate-binding protein
VNNTFDPGPYPYDPARAKQLLAEAGYAGGLEIQLWQSIGRWTLAEEMAQVIAGYWEKVGIKTKLQFLEWAEYNKRSGTSQFKDAFYYAFINGTWDASYTVQRFKPEFASFRYFDASGDLLKAIRDYEQTFDAKRRKELAATALKGLHDEAVWVFLWQLEQLTGVSKKVKGFKIRPDDFIWARDAYVEA